MAERMLEVTKKYKVEGYMTTDFYTIVEAENEDEAYEKARESEDWTAYDDFWGSGDWEVSTNPIEIKDTKDEEEKTKEKKFPSSVPALSQIQE